MNRRRWAALGLVTAASLPSALARADDAGTDAASEPSPAPPIGTPRPRSGPTVDASEADKHAARELVAAGDIHFEKGEYDEALKKYRGADTIMRVPTTGIEVARTLQVLRRWLEARTVYQRIVQRPAAEGEPEAFTRARERADAALGELASLIPSLRVLVEGGDPDARVVVNVDQHTVEVGAPVELDPGEHLVEIVVAGAIVESRQVELLERAEESVTVVLPAPPEEEAPPAPPPPSPSSGELLPWWGWVGIGVAGAGLVAGGVTGGLSLSKAGELDDTQLPDGSYPESSRPLQEDGLLFAHISTASFAVAGAGAAVGILAVVLELTDDDDGGEADAELRLTVSPQRLGMKLSF